MFVELEVQALRVGTYVCVQVLSIESSFAVQKQTSRPSVRPSVCPSVRLSVCPCVRASVCPSVRAFVRACVRAFVRAFVRAHSPLTHSLTPPLINEEQPRNRRTHRPACLLACLTTQRQ